MIIFMHLNRDTGKKSAVEVYTDIFVEDMAQTLAALGYRFFSEYQLGDLTLRVARMPDEHWTPMPSPLVELVTTIEKARDEIGPFICHAYWKVRHADSDVLPPCGRRVS